MFSRAYSKGGLLIQLDTGSDSSMNDANHLVESGKHTNFLLAPFFVISNFILHKNLIGNLIKRDVKLQYRDSILGWIWSLVEPLLLSIVYYFFFTIIRDVPDRAYTFWVIVGVIVWTLFTRSLVNGVACLRKNKSMIKQVYFPREIFPISIVGSQLIIYFKLKNMV